MHALHGLYNSYACVYHHVLQVNKMLHMYSILNVCRLQVLAIAIVSVLY